MDEKVNVSEMTQEDINNVFEEFVNLASFQKVPDEKPASDYKFEKASVLIDLPIMYSSGTAQT